MSNPTQPTSLVTTALANTICDDMPLSGVCYMLLTMVDVQVPN